MKHFKRFTELTVKSIPESAKLVVMAGPNGCGKSSLFDAFQAWIQHRKGYVSWDPAYHIKQGSRNEAPMQEAVDIVFHGQETLSSKDPRKAFYVRTAFRNDPYFALGSLSKEGPQLAESRFNLLCENDIAVSKNYRRLISQALDGALASSPEETTLSQFRQDIMGDIKASLQCIFPDLNLNNLGNPLE